jgi:23S rRNA pseudouridine2605 synthase
LRLNRFLALSGLGARRKCESFISEGRIEVNGVTVESPGLTVDPDKDRITCDGERLRPPRVFLYAAMHKPSGLIVSASDEMGRSTVYDLLPERLRGKVRAVGRLDQASEGLLLFTNDGELANALLHPSYGVERTYMVWVTPPPSPDSLAALRSGVPLGRGQKSGAAQVRVLGTRGSTSRVRVILREGKNREVRRMFRAVGCRVLALRRVQYGAIVLGGLRPGQWRNLLPSEVAALRRATKHA